jgi:hypothetical protein
MRRFDEAVQKLRLAIQEDPSFPEPYRFLAACYAHKVGSLMHEKLSLGYEPSRLW